METRRGFLERTLAMVATAAAFSPAESILAEPRTARGRFSLKYAPHAGMFKGHAGEDILEQLRFMADQGFTAFEDNGLMSRTVAQQEAIGRTMTQLGMTMGVFVIDWRHTRVALTTGKPEFRDEFLAACRAAIGVASRVNARWATVVPGFFDRRLPIGIQTGHVIDALRAGAEILAPSPLTMVLEPLSDTPELFLRTSDQTYAICRAVGSPACKILFDMYHMQRNEGSLIENMNLVWDEIAYFQIGDNPGRNEPGTGEMNYGNLLRHIHDKGYRGVLGMEHGNARSGKSGEKAVIEAYVAADAAIRPREVN